MHIINGKYTGAVITAQETAMVGLFNLVIDGAAYKDFKVGSVVGTDSIITPSYTEETGFSFHISLAELP